MKNNLGGHDHFQGKGASDDKSEWPFLWEMACFQQFVMDNLKKKW